MSSFLIFKLFLDLKFLAIKVHLWQFKGKSRIHQLMLKDKIQAWLISYLDQEAHCLKILAKTLWCLLQIPKMNHIMSFLIYLQLGCNNFAKISSMTFRIHFHFQLCTTSTFDPSSFQGLPNTIMKFLQELYCWNSRFQFILILKIALWVRLHIKELKFQNCF